ncbi:MAG TPA: response regulator [Polyangiaceae bacterium]|nr:response regulator [Polyangiaceae bacterium]
MAGARTILVVDDSASVRQQLRQALEEGGYSVVEADNGESGLAAARDAPVDLMIVDVNMPIMDGIEMIAKVRALKEHKSTPIFVLTTESGASAVKDGKSAGATAWIVKPVKPDALVKGIRATLGA